MTQINLLPWREQARKVKQIRFGITLGVFVCITLIIVGILHLYYHSVVNYQERRNAFIQTQITKATAELAELDAKKEGQDEIVSDLAFLIMLRNESYNAVSLLDELVRVVPEGISLNRIVRNKNNIVLYGKSASDVQITLFMKNISKSSIFKQPVLSEFTAKENNVGNETYFQLQVEQRV